MSQKDKKLLQSKHEEERQKTRQLLQQSLHTEEGWLLKAIEKVDHFSFDYLSLLHWLTKWKPQWNGNLSVVESYVVGWLLLELTFFSLLIVYPVLTGQSLWVILVSVLLVYRWYNIVTYWFHTHVLTGRVSSPVRALILTVINFAEIVVIFAVLDFNLPSSFTPAFVSIQNSLDYSVRIMTTLGWDKYEPAGFGYVFFYIQIFSGIGTIAIVIGAVMSYFKR